MVVLLGLFFIQLGAIVFGQSGNLPPKFVLNGESEILLQLREGPDTPVGSVIYTLHGEDPDGDALVFGVQGIAAAELVKIEATGPTEANIVLKRELDREIKDEYTMILTLTDGKMGDGYYITQSMIILVLDVNDNEPVFKPYNSSLLIREDALPSEIASVEATDRDEGPFGQVVYELQEPDGTSGKFQIQTVNGRGVISLIGNLDYEHNNMYQLQVLAKDRPSFGRRNTGTAALLVKVVDVEDQPPEFVRVPSVTRIPENVPQGSLVLEVRAVDGDRGVNNKISYTLKEKGGQNDLFVIHPDSGQVFAQGLLDREAGDFTDAYTLQIQAKEVNSSVYPSPSATTEVTVMLIDLNDETPRFRSLNYVGEIAENAHVSLPVTFTTGEPEVTDRDQGVNGTFRLYLESPIDIFEITPSEGINEVSFLIRVKNSTLLDFESLKTVELKIVAVEMVSEGAKSSSANMTIYIRDTNDNFPEFELAEYVISVPEDVPLGTTIARIQAFDPDSGAFGSGGIRYTALTGQIADRLSLDIVSGFVTVLTSSHGFDREQTAQHYLTVEARDDEGRGNRNTVQMVIQVEDVNDNAPKFLQQVYEARLFENEHNFVTPLILQAHDGDLNGTANSRISYSIVDIFPPANLTINGTTGIVSISVPVDFEHLLGSDDVKTINLTVRAQDHGIPPLFADIRVIVYVMDVNDNAPKFDNAIYATTVPEDARSGTVILRVHAVDADQSSSLGRVVYRIKSGAQDKFVIDAETGAVSIAQGANLDPDHTEPKIMSYILEVAALDGGIGPQQKQAVVMVNITVSDVNNKPPEFQDPGVVYVAEDTTPGQIVTTLVAIDPDSSAHLHFALDDSLSEARNEEGGLVKQGDYNFTGAFELNSTSGVLLLAKELDREKAELIKLFVIVEDLQAVNGVQTATATLTVKVEDVNDNSPVFRKDRYLRAVTENAKEGTPILTVVAYDADKNRTIEYTLQGPPNVISLIRIDATTGELSVNRKIDREVFQWLNVSVLAADNGHPPRASAVEVSIQVVDENDNNPIFAEGEASFTVPEDAAPGTKVGIVEATDADLGENGKITYLLDKKTSLGKFSIDPNLGVLVVADSLDREIRDSYNLIVEAWDNYQFGFNSRESRNAFMQVLVKVLDVNDEVPSLPKPTSCVAITEYHDIQETVTTLRAEDKDDPITPNSRVLFSIVDGDNKGLFGVESVDRSSARLFVTQPLRQHVGNYSLKVKAEDRGLPPLHSTQYIDVCVTDFNDNAPIFVSPSQNFTVKVPEDAEVGSLVVEVSAVDDDSGPNGVVRYRIKKDTFGHWQAFQVDEKTGAVTLRQTLDREQQKMYQIRVEAYDLGTPTALASDLDLTIYVRNVNDIEPYFTQPEQEVHFTENVAPNSEKQLLMPTVDDEEYDDDETKPPVCYFLIAGDEDGLFELDPFTHELTVLESLDRETRDSFTLAVHATEDCLQIPENPLTSRSTLRVNVRVDDVNDNAPQFRRRVFTGGVTTEAQFGTLVLQLQATDGDTGLNARTQFFTASHFRQSLAEGVDMVSKRPFIVNQTSGEIRLNFDPQKDMKGYFDFDVLVNDTGGLFDTATVFIYLLRADQRVKFIMRLTPQELRGKIEDFRDVLGNITSAIVNVDTYKYHSLPDGSVDKTKSDLYAHFVQRKDNSIMDVATVLKLIDENIEFLTALFQDFNVIDSRPAEEGSYLLEKEDLVRAWLIGLSVFLGAMLILVISLCLTQRSRYERKLRAATATAFGSQDSGLNRTDVPNTNQHSIEGSNPIWMQSYTNEWYKDDDSVSHKSDSDNSLDENALNEHGQPAGTSPPQQGQQQQQQQQTQQQQQQPPQPIPRPTANRGELTALALERGLTSLREQNDLNRTYRRNIYESVGKHINPLNSKLETTEL